MKSLAGISFLVRYDVDTFAIDHLPPDQGPNTAQKIMSLLVGHNGSMSRRSRPTNVAEISVKRGGILVPQSTLLKIKIRSAFSELDTFDAFCQLFFSQTPTLKLVGHFRGEFSSVKDFRLDSMREEEEEAQEPLSKLCEGLKVIMEMARTSGETKFSFICKRGKLTMWRRIGDRDFPDELVAYFECQISWPRYVKFESTNHF